MVNGGYDVMSSRTFVGGHLGKGWGRVNSGTCHTTQRTRNVKMFPYLTFGLSAWGQAAQLHLNKLLLLRKRAIRFMNFSKARTHAVPLFISSKILPINNVHFNVRHL